MRLTHKIILITGAARGIGKAIAELFHQEGGYVILSDIRDDEGEQVARSLRDRAEYRRLDVYTSPIEQPRRSRKKSIFPPSNRDTCERAPSVKHNVWRYWPNGMRGPM